jgi:hypothetical protein
VVALGVTVTVVPVVADKPVLGVQLYVVAPDAVNEVLEPEQTVVVPDTLTVGELVTVITCDAVAVQPAAVVPVTV